MMKLQIKAESSLEAARARLATPRRREAALPVLGAAALAAVSAMALAASVILGPPGMAHAQTPDAPAGSAAPGAEP
jgi:hypothetical protein